MVTRRNFLRTSSMLAAGTLLPVAAEGSILQSISPNEQINVALIGCRNMGWVNLADFLKQPNVRCVALCDVNRPLLEERAATLEKEHRQKVDLYGDYRRLLERND